MSWHHEPAGHVRLTLETALVHQDYPQMQVLFCADGKVRVAGYLKPELCYSAYYVVLEYPDCYPYDRITVQCPQTEFADGTPHRYGDGTLCVEHHDFEPDDTVSTVLGWTAQWLTLYEDFLRTGRIW